MIDYFELWWTVWWPWALVWVATVLVLLVAVVVLVRQWRKGRKLPRTDGVGLHLDNEAVLEFFGNYLKKAEPSAVIDILVKIMKQDDSIVHVNLEKKSVRHNSTLETVLDDDLAASGRMTVRAGALGSGVVSLTGWYRADERDGTSAFRAPFGKPDQVDDGPRVRFEVSSARLRQPLPDGAFRANCLGRIRRWEPQTGELTIDAIALFR